MGVRPGVRDDEWKEGDVGTPPTPAAAADIMLDDLDPVGDDGVREVAATVADAGTTTGGGEVLLREDKSEVHAAPLETRA